ncbi:MAG: RDD family protein [Solirubrobacteraceae bacterium]
MAVSPDPFGATAARPVTSGARGPQAGFWQGFGAVLIGGLLLGVINFALTAALKGVGYALAILIGIAYIVYFEGGATGQTLGERALGIRVVDANTDGPIGYPRAFVRYIGKIVSAIPIFLGYLWMLWDREKQTWHDKMAGDVVVPVSAYPV